MIWEPEVGKLRRSISFCRCRLKRVDVLLLHKNRKGVIKTGILGNTGVNWVVNNGKSGFNIKQRKRDIVAYARVGTSTQTPGVIFRFAQYRLFSERLYSFSVCKQPLRKNFLYRAPGYKEGSRWYTGWLKVPPYVIN